jgi:hypothetical protein
MRLIIVTIVCFMLTSMFFLVSLSFICRETGTVLAQTCMFIFAAIGYLIALAALRQIYNAEPEDQAVQLEVQEIAE